MDGIAAAGCGSGWTACPGPPQLANLEGAARPRPCLGEERGQGQRCGQRDGLSGGTCWMRPRMDCMTWATWPWPPQVEQVVGVVPSFTPLPLHVPQDSRRVIVISLLLPIAYCKSVRTCVRQKKAEGCRASSRGFSLHESGDCLFCLTHVQTDLQYQAGLRRSNLAPCCQWGTAPCCRVQSESSLPDPLFVIRLMRDPGGSPCFILLSPKMFT